MSVPENCTVLVIGGGPAGSYAAAVLAREGIETVVLEAEKFPRYHIGESTLPSLRHFFKFNDFYDVFNSHGFYHKNGAVFRLAQGQPDACKLYTDFLEAGGSEGYAWNLIRSESDDLLFRHAGNCGVHIFDETKSDAIQFSPSYSSEKDTHSQGKANNFIDHGQPVSATWARNDGTSGSIKFKYLVDASGRRGILSTKYLKNRSFNDNFKNTANWAYWKSDNLYGTGTHMHGSPYFEALDGECSPDFNSAYNDAYQMDLQQDASGWAWFMPLHDGTRSVGIVQPQKLAVERKRELGNPSTLDFYTSCLGMAPKTKSLLDDAEIVTDITSAADWSYTASTYHIQNARICGDAGSFIDPLFSSGYHLAVTGGLSAVVTIAASIRGDCNEQTAGSSHSKKTVESYTRFFLAVSSTTKQIRTQHEPVIQDMNEDGFQRAFDLFKPIIQGTVDADAKGKVTVKDISHILEFCFRAFTYVSPEKKDALFAKLKSLRDDTGNNSMGSDRVLKNGEGDLTVEEQQILEILRSRRMIREDPFEIDSFTLDTIDGLAPNLLRGELGLTEAEEAKINEAHYLSSEFLDGKFPGIREGSVYLPTSKVVLG